MPLFSWRNLRNRILRGIYPIDAIAAALEQVDEGYNEAGGIVALDAFGLIDQDVLGLGTSDATKYLRGDQTWTALVVENRTSDPASPVNGQLWLRTDL